MARANGRGRGGRVIQSKIDCPTYDPDLDNYEYWREAVGVWKRVTRARKKAQGALLYFAIRGNAIQHLHNMDKDVMTSEGGVEAILKILDDVYMPEIFDKNTETSITYGAYIGRLVSHYSHSQGSGILNFRHTRTLLGIFHQKQLR